MSIVKPDRSPPQDIVFTIRDIELQAIIENNFRNFSESIVLYRQILDLMLETQVRIGRPIHKGAPLHMIGINYIGLNNHTEAIRYIMLAYIEDTLNADYENESEADNTPAGQMLRNFYNIHIRLLGDIKSEVHERKRQGDWSNILQPDQIFTTLGIRFEEGIISSRERRSRPTRPMTETPEPQPFGFPEPWENRVFIGGSYHTHMHVIRHIENVVRGLGFTPIIAMDVNIAPEYTHQHTLILLHTCKFAIFDVSNPAGQLMEIERTIDYENEKLLVYSTLEPGGEPSPYVSSMLQTMNIRMEGFANLPDLDPIIRVFLLPPQ